MEFRRKKEERSSQMDSFANASLLGKCWLQCRKKQKQQEPMETVMLEKTIIKLGGLLSLCFGEEGGEIISQYILDGAERSVASANLDIVVPGHRVEAVIAFCQIHHFDHVT